MRLNPSGDREYAIDDNPGPSPALVGNVDQELEVLFGVVMVSRRDAGETCDIE